MDNPTLNCIIKGKENKKCLICGLSDNENYYLIPCDHLKDEDATHYEYAHVTCMTQGMFRYNRATRLIYWLFLPSLSTKNKD